MEKPEDIPQDVWDVAKDLSDACYRNYSPISGARAIARALLDATATERRACLEAAEDNRYRFDPHDYEARGWNNASEAIATVIRNRALTQA